MKPRSSTSPPVQAVARALALVEALAGSDERGLVDLARRTGLRPSTAHRLLATLIECGYVVQSQETARYRLGHKLLELAGGPEGRDARLCALARPHLETIRREVDETTNLATLEGFSIVYLDQAGSTRPVRMFTQPGRRVPAHASGAGKAMLAFQPEQVISELLARAPLERLTANTITRAREFQAELEAVRERGYAFDHEEYEEGVSCISAPILDHTGHAHAALSVSAPSARLRPPSLSKLGELIARHALELSRGFGYRETEETPGTS